MGLSGTWNHTKSIFRTPCDAGNNVGLYVETALRAATPVLFDFLSFGCREPLKHAAGRGQFADWFGRDNVRGFPTPHRRPRVKGGSASPPYLKAGNNAFWWLSAGAERALFYWFLFELGQEFLVNWSSLIYAERGCGGRPAGLCTWNIQPQVIGPNDTEVLIGATSECHGVLSDIRSIYIPAGLQASIGYGMKTEPWPGQPRPDNNVQSHLWARDDGGAWGGAVQDGTGNGDTGLVGHAHNISGGLGAYRRISIVARSDPGYTSIVSGHVHVSLQGHQVPLVPLTDCFKGRKASSMGAALDKAFGIPPH